MGDTERGDAMARHTAAGVLAQLYRAIYYLTAIIEATDAGAVARAARAAQVDLWGAIEHLGGSRDGFMIWAARRDQALGVVRRDD